MRKIWHIFRIFMAVLVLGTCCNISASKAATCTADRDYCTPDNPFFQSGYGGQCTSYAWGRAYEKFDINLSPRGHGGTWLDSTVTNLTTDDELSTGNTVRSNSIAVWSFGTFGHVAFVENVENGRVYFTEANWSTYTDSNYGGGVDNEGNQKSLSVAEFETRNTTSGTYNISGYIYLSNNSCISIYGASATTPATFENFKVGFGIKNNCGLAKTVENVAVSFHEFSNPDNFIQTCYKPNPEISTIIADDATYFFAKTSCNIPKDNLSPKKYKLRYKVKYDGTWYRNVLERDIEILPYFQPNNILPTLSLLLSGKPHTNLQDGLVAHYEFEGNANDSSGNGNRGTQYGNLTYSTGISGQAAKFDGVNDYIEIYSDGELITQEDFSFFAWVKPYSFSENNCHQNVIFTQNDISDGYVTHQVYFGVDDDSSGPGIDDALSYDHWLPSGGFVTAESTLPLNEWTHIAVVKNGNMASFYINGQLDTQRNHLEHRNSATAIDNVLIGSRYYWGTTNCEYHGLIDEVRIYNRALTANEVLEIHNFDEGN